MLRKLLVVLAISLAVMSGACIVDEYKLRCETGFESSGIVFCLERAESYDLGRIESIVYAIESRVRYRYSRVRDIKSLFSELGLMVVVANVQIMHNCGTFGDSAVYLCRGRYGAIADQTHNVIVIPPPRDGCFDGLLAHELLHIVAYRLIDGHYLHETPGVFATGDGTSIEDELREYINLRLTCHGLQ